MTYMLCQIKVQSGVRVALFCYFFITLIVYFFKTLIMPSFQKKRSKEEEDDEV